MSNRSQGDRGAVAVEFALVLPILVVLLVGTVTTGVSYSHGLGLTNAVREGSRFAASTTPVATPPTPPFTIAQWTAWGDDVIARMRATQFDDPAQETTVCVQVWKNDSDDPAVPTAVLPAPKCTAGGPSAGSASTPPKIAGHSCAVSVWGARNFTINAVFVQFDRTMRRESLAQYERAC